MKQVVFASEIKSDKFNQIAKNSEKWYGSEVKAQEYQKPDNSKMMKISLPDPLGTRLKMEDGRVEILDSLSKEAMLELAAYFHMLGIRDIRFPVSEVTDKKFEEKFNNAFYSFESETGPAEDGFAVYPKWYKDDTNVGGKKDNPTTPVAKAEKSIMRWLHASGKRDGVNAKIRATWGGGFTIKTYPSAKAMDSSGQIDRESWSTQQNWDFYCKVEPINYRGKNSLAATFDTAEGKDIGAGQAVELVGALKQGGVTHIRLGTNITDTDKVELLKAGAKQGIVMDTTYNKNNVSMMIEECDKSNLPLKDKLLFKKRLAKQIRENMAYQGKLLSENPDQELWVQKLEATGKLDAMGAGFQQDKIDKAGSVGEINNILKFAKFESIYNGSLMPELQAAIDKNDAVAIISAANSLAFVLKTYEACKDPDSKPADYWLKNFKVSQDRLHPEISKKLCESRDSEFTAVEKSTENAQRVLRNTVSNIRKNYGIQYEIPDLPEGAYERPAKPAREFSSSLPHPRNNSR